MCSVHKKRISRTHALPVAVGRVLLLLFAVKVAGAVLSC